MVGDCQEVTASDCFSLSRDGTSYFGRATCRTNSIEIDGRLAGIIVGGVFAFVLVFIIISLIMRKRNLSRITTTATVTPAKLPEQPVPIPVKTVVNYGQPAGNNSMNPNIYPPPPMGPNPPFAQPQYFAGTPMTGYPNQPQVMYVQPGMYMQPAVVPGQQPPIQYAYVQTGVTVPPPVYQPK